MVVDANVLLYAADPDARHHEQARAWMDGALSGTTQVLIPWISILAFVRIITNGSLYRKPLPVDLALDHVEDLLNAPPVKVPIADAGTVGSLRALLSETGAGGNLTNDAFVAAIALQHGVPVVSFDNDFSRFTEVEWIKPG